VGAAIETGLLPAERFQSWNALRREAAAAEQRADPYARHRAGRQWGKIAREAQRMKRPNR